MARGEHKSGHEGIWGEGVSEVTNAEESQAEVKSKRTFQADALEEGHLTHL